MLSNKPTRFFLSCALVLPFALGGLIAFGAASSNLQQQDISPSVRDQAGAARVSEPLDYRSSQIIVTDPEGIAYNADVNALVRYPLDGDGPFPVVLYLHGRHVTCSYLGTEFLSTGECDLELPSVLGQPLNVVKSVDSYKGYDYMARNLAAHGYVVVSINANDVNDKDLAGDAGVQARSELILHHLDILREINRTGFYSKLDEPYLLASLRGKIDMGKVGLMGHSRGGQGVTHSLSVNQARGPTLEVGEVTPAGSAFNQPHNINAVFALAPTNFDIITAPNATFAVLLPYCDGDVSNLQGAFMYDESRNLEETTPSRKFQLVTMGANHNFYNTTWSGDDYSNNDSWCDSAAETSGRDSPIDQRRHGEFLMSSFFRLFLGNETQFSPYWSGMASLPADACPVGSANAGQRCDERVHLTIQTPKEQRLEIDNTATATSLTNNQLGGANGTSDTDRFEFCSTRNESGTVNSTGCPSLRTWATSGQNQVDIWVVHQLVRQLNARLIDPADDVFRCTGGNGCIQYQLGSGIGGVLGTGVRGEDDGVAGLERDHGFEDRSGGRVGGRNDTADDTYRLGDGDGAHLVVLAQDAAGLLVFVCVVDVFGGEVVFDNLVFDDTHT